MVTKLRPAHSCVGLNRSLPARLLVPVHVHICTAYKTLRCTKIQLQLAAVRKGVSTLYMYTYMKHIHVGMQVHVYARIATKVCKSLQDTGSLNKSTCSMLMVAVSASGELCSDCTTYQPGCV